jgi:hypothetical protein
LFKIGQKLVKNWIKIGYIGKASGEEGELDEELQETEDWWLVDQLRLRRTW